MSTPAGAPRRRKIAGERRPGRPVPPVGGEAPAGDSGPAVDLTEAEAPSQAPPSAGPPPPPPLPTDPTAPRRGRWTGRGATAAAPSTARTGGGPAWWGSIPVVAALGVLLFALVVAVVLYGTGSLGNPSFSEAKTTKADAKAWEDGQSAPATAERAATSILAYDYRSLAATEKEATQFMTSDYAKQYTQTFEKVVVPAAKQQKAKVTAEVQASSVVRSTADQVKVLLYVDQTTVSAANQTPQVALNRVEMVMVPRSGGWAVDQITSY